MKGLTKFLVGLIVVVLLAVITLYATGNDHLLTAMPKTYLIGRTGPDIDDAKHYHNEIITKGSPQPWKVAENFNQKSLSEAALKNMEEMATVSFLVIEDGELVFEKYWEGYDQTTPANSFSMAKSIVSMAIGIAIDEGKIPSIDQKAAAYFPIMKEDDRKDITIKNLLQMTSGIGFDESYSNPFGYMSKMYFGNKIMEKTLAFEQKHTPGDVWKYAGGNTILLASIVEKATGVSLHEYVAEKLWRPMGAETDALWSTDRDEQVEKSYCCFHSNVRDFSRFGKLFLCHGNWEGKQLISTEYIDASLKPTKLNNGDDINHYGYQWWLGEHKGMDFWAMRGLHGQYVIVVPEKDLIISRMGHDRTEEKRNNITLDVYDYIDAGLNIINQ